MTKRRLKINDKNVDESTLEICMALLEDKIDKTINKSLKREFIKAYLQIKGLSGLFDKNK